ncbi:hypothetical protein TGDOM2_360890 [Toxoplasma gondii GAB2-2007-GAL-DOM2]|uniref:Uncharacterized protein n=2 Tax=Toxoplasma gondii TaxID=5811 RepID=A0A086K5C0_TOXGO|nr:hypothetical protein TGP89_360890 [Toxoplasma gondii p89]KFG39588.1 hypothetical protein TGDOM2_360890 [Toxoplasma gondii GAB2-2007-GAL-DOM2]
MRRAEASFIMRNVQERKSRYVWMSAGGNGDARTAASSCHKSRFFAQKRPSQLSLPEVKGSQDMQWKKTYFLRVSRDTLRTLPTHVDRCRHRDRHGDVYCDACAMALCQSH